jgi:hypothetical protein
MGQKVNATGFRVGQANLRNKGWKNVWLNTGKNIGTRVQEAYWGEQYLKRILQKKGLVFVKAALEIQEKGCKTPNEVCDIYTQWKGKEQKQNQTHTLNNKTVYKWKVDVLAQPFLDKWKKNKAVTEDPRDAVASKTGIGKNKKYKGSNHPLNNQRERDTWLIISQEENQEFSIFADQEVSNYQEN